MTEKKIVKKNIAIISHDGKKAEMVAIVMQHKEIFKLFNVFATGTTGSHIERAGLTVTKFNSGPLGGDAQIGAMIAEGNMDFVIFLRDPLGIHPHEPDVLMLLRLCDVHNIPLATNKATVELILNSFSDFI